MKSSVILLFVMLLATSAHALVQTEDEIRAALEDWEKAITTLPDNATPNAFSILGEAVFKLSRDKEMHREWRRRLFKMAQTKALSLPGHAQYFADLIEAERAALKPEEYRGDYDRHRYLFLCETLRHLPSPETVLVLGRYLEDDRDTYPPPTPGDDSGIDPPNSIIAMESLLLLELRDAPYPPGRWYWYRSTKELATVRAWFAPIKSGEKPFSFKGQAVEYRFNPDGTWVSNPIANPPDDAPKPPPAKPPITSSPEKSPAVAAAQSHQPALWPWLGGVLLAVLGILIWQIKARCARKSP
jgi:hypothetical protein